MSSYILVMGGRGGSFSRWALAINYLLVCLSCTVALASTSGWTRSAAYLNLHPIKSFNAEIFPCHFQLHNKYLFPHGIKILVSLTLTIYPACGLLLAYLKGKGNAIAIKVVQRFLFKINQFRSAACMVPGMQRAGLTCCTAWLLTRDRPIIG